MRRGIVFVISAPSGSGKTTLIKRLLASSRKLVHSVSMTTRRRRKGERNGRDYYFVTKGEFRRRIFRRKFLEWAKNFGNYYGTPRKFVEESLKKGRDVILSIDVQGAMQVKRRMRSAVYIFIVPPSFAELGNRLRKRNTEGRRTISRRLSVAKKELKYIKKYNYIVINDSIGKALKELKAVIAAERCRVKK